MLVPVRDSKRIAEHSPSEKGENEQSYEPVPRITVITSVVRKAFDYLVILSKAR